MSTETWVDDVLSKLKVRDEVEKKDSEYYLAFKQLVEKLLSKEQQHHHHHCQSNTEEEDETPFSSKSPSPSTILGIEKEKVPPSTKSKSKSVQQDKLKDNISDNDAATVVIIKENHQLRNENEDLITNLNSITLKNEKLEFIIKDKDVRIGKLEKLVSKLQKQIEHLSIEMKEKNKTIELINDENLTNQIQLNVLRDRIEKDKR
ncbi:Autophagy protein 16 (ATG16) family protein [Candida parapsilosis]|uniref:ATG16 domain-containing protein n=2 Tax=Candida parapsilosis TaxID=5480 RepID=G8BGN5_CANPC|nr:uncharacterized protein CPAR2_502570 [Candida parapsilosis]KAF6044638.1 Autophagy protein 16 (ATG16) family protein [Candida parapsilosis]KAF6044975.1 Autophagy protein 16 (ATG16) family protein [Candida parapsilosis]KAF6048879.1 Autophagy protein 16 (ATG16) family protein [Candida parapsilosis]KAF6060879.1 Autophagy protein 16 (ATG16) family protein [Candida parapsilosis]KAI5905624.1 hypothetical protein K4G60_g4884 [Candida parapsilosis]